LRQASCASRHVPRLAPPGSGRLRRRPRPPGALRTLRRPPQQPPELAGAQWDVDGAWPLPAGIVGSSTDSVLDVKMPLAPSQLVTVMLTVTITDAGGSQVLQGSRVQAGWDGSADCASDRTLLQAVHGYADLLVCQAAVGSSTRPGSPAERSGGEGCRGVSGEPGRRGPARTPKQGPRLNGDCLSRVWAPC
jgi:hypothetical protein